MGWTNGEKLLCVQEDGVVLVLNVQGEVVTTFSMGRVSSISYMHTCTC